MRMAMIERSLPFAGAVMCAALGYVLAWNHAVKVTRKSAYDDGVAAAMRYLGGGL